MIQLVAVDMDGTLLDTQGKITEVTRKAIHEIQDKGVEFIICTGRHYRDAKEILEQAGITCGFICLSGAAIYDMQGENLLHIPLTKEQLETLIPIFKRRNMGMDVLTGQGVYSSLSREGKLQNIQGFMKKRSATGELSSRDLQEALDRVSTVHFLDKPEDILCIPAEVFKICINDIAEEDVVSLKQEFTAYPQFAAASSFPTNIEITDVRAQKGPALEIYAGLRGIPVSEVMAIGDSDNDLSMFTMNFGYPVAMGNAMECIKEKTKYHTSSNAEDGVARAIHDYILVQDKAL